MVAAITRDGSDIYVALNHNELVDLQRGEMLVLPGDLLILPYAIVLVPVESAEDGPPEIPGLPEPWACLPLLPAMIADLARNATLRCPHERLPTLFLCVGGTQAEIQAAIIEASRGQDVLVRMMRER